MAPEISIIIPVHNDPEGLADTLESLVAQNFPVEAFEIIVADNGSSDSTQDVARSYAEKYPHLVQVVVEDRIQSSYAARNKGIEAAKAEILSFIDADMTVKPDWLGKIYRVMLDESPDYLGCNVRIYSTRRSAASLYNVLTGFPVKNYMERAHYAPTCCLTVKREVFSRVGAFDNRLKSGGDTEFGNRVWESGAKFHFAQNIYMYHPARGTMRAHLKKAMRIGRYGRGDMSSLFPDKYPYHRIYLSWARYLPRKPWKLRRRFRCGYAFKTSTVLMFTTLPILTHYVSLAGFLRTKMKYFLQRKLKSGRSMGSAGASDGTE